jgi:hypothetical protein
LSLDEAASIHEMGTALQPVLHTTGYLAYGWVIPGSIFVLIVLVMSLRFLAALPMYTRRLFLTAGAIYVGGALRIEMLEAQYETLHGRENLTYSLLLQGVEEGMEMVGIIIFLYALSSYLSSYRGEVVIEFRGRSHHASLPERGNDEPRVIRQPPALSSHVS